MSTIVVKFSDGHEFKLSGTSEAFNIDAYIEEYTKENPGVKHTGTEYLGDVPEDIPEEYRTIHANDTVKLTDEQLAEMVEKDKALFTEENVYAADYIINLTGKEEDGSDAKLKGMGELDMLAQLDEISFMRSVLFIRHNPISRAVIDTPLMDIKKEELENVLIHKGLFASYNEERGIWQCPLYQRDGVIIITDRTRINALLRAFITRMTGMFYTNNDILDTIVNRWKELNGIKQDPRFAKNDALEAAAKRVGTTLDEIEQAYLDEMAKQD